MSDPFPISLQFGPEVEKAVRARIEYAFRVFAAIYGHAVVANHEGESVARCFYGHKPPASLGAPHFHIPHLYRAEIPRAGDRWCSSYYAGEEFCLSYGLDAFSGRPDWLGEIFLWLSSSYETGIRARDSVGRIPYSETIFARSGLSPRKAHAARLMAWMEGALSRGGAEAALVKAPSPLSGTEHLVVCSHDIDFYHVGRASAMVRHLKNLALAVLRYKDTSFLTDNLRMMLQLCMGQRIGQYLPALIEAAASEYDVASTLFIVARRGHRRDPNYSVEQISSELSTAQERGFSLGIHGSYRSVVEDRTLADEARALSVVTDRRVLANRQHWLRFAQHHTLFDEVERAGLLADSTLGFSEEIGFRNGACFAFPPYNFAQERPYSFLEVPLVIMDGALQAVSRGSRTPAQSVADEVLSESRRYGWGGVSLLWHNPIEPISVPSEINAVFWNCARRKKEFHERWVSAEEFLAVCAERYQKAGLLALSEVPIRNGKRT